MICRIQYNLYGGRTQYYPPCSCLGPTRIDHYIIENNWTEDVPTFKVHMWHTVYYNIELNVTYNINWYYRIRLIIQFRTFADYRESENCIVRIQQIVEIRQWNNPISDRGASPSLGILGWLGNCIAQCWLKCYDFLMTTSFTTRN